MQKQRFDTDTWRPELPARCEVTLGARPSCVLFEGGWQSALAGVRLTDGRDVVVKIRHAEHRVVACDLVHRHLFARGFPCPKPRVSHREAGAQTERGRGDGRVGSAVATYCPIGIGLPPESFSHLRGELEVLGVHALESTWR